jgi:dolichol-phosphate mannosyltransferase
LYFGFKPKNSIGKNSYHTNYNEKENIADILKAIFSLDQGYHVLVVDDNSPDGTANLILSLQKEYDGSYF